MNKWYGTIGFVFSEETTPGVWKNRTVERNYYGEISRNMKRWQSGDGLNDNITISNIISVIADPYILDELASVRYVVWRNSKWKVTDAEEQYPRLKLTLGGIYNG